MRAYEILTKKKGKTTMKKSENSENSAAWNCGFDFSFNRGFADNVPYLFPYACIKKSEVFSQISIFIVDIVITDNINEKTTAIINNIFSS